MSSVEFQLLRDRIERLYNELRIMEEQLHPVITRLRRALGEFLGVEPVTVPAPTPPPPEAEVTARRIMVAEEVREVAPPPTTRPLSMQEMMLLMLTTLAQGVRLAVYTDHKFVVSPEPISFEGTSHDLGDVYNALILVPTIDTQIELDKPVEVNTPVIKAQTAFNVEAVKVRKIFYKGVTPGLIGEMNIWAFKY